MINLVIFILAFALGFLLGKTLMFLKNFRTIIIIYDDEENAKKFFNSICEKLKKS
ncbi:MAG: hypothetical protein ABIK66_06740 [candidate division WOR-3 bacterium]